MSGDLCVFFTCEFSSRIGSSEHPACEYAQTEETCKKRHYLQKAHQPGVPISGCVKCHRTLVLRELVGSEISFSSYSMRANSREFNGFKVWYTQTRMCLKFKHTRDWVYPAEHWPQFEISLRKKELSFVINVETWWIKFVFFGRKQHSNTIWICPYRRDDGMLVFTVCHSSHRLLSYSIPSLPPSRLLFLLVGNFPNKSLSTNRFDSSFNVRHAVISLNTFPDRYSFAFISADESPSPCGWCNLNKEISCPWNTPRHSVKNAKV